MRTTKAQEALNIAEPAYRLAQADQNDFIPTLAALSKEELFSIAIEYNARLESGEKPQPATAKRRLVKAIIQNIQERVAHTRQQYEQALEACRQEETRE